MSYAHWLRALSRIAQDRTTESGVIDTAREQNDEHLRSWRRKWLTGFVGVPTCALAGQLMYERHYALKRKRALDWMARHRAPEPQGNVVVFTMRRGGR
jgi:hypothetical protein